MMSCHGADGDDVAILADVTQIADAADVNQVFRLGKAEFHHRDQAMSAGEQFGVIGVCREQGKRLGQRGGPVIFEISWYHPGFLSYADGIFTRPFFTSSLVNLAPLPFRFSRTRSSTGGASTWSLRSSIARHTFSGVSGRSMCFTPSGLRASRTALAMAGVAPMVPASPTPLMPSGLTGLGVMVWPRR